jgi:hypothetical protein
VCGRTDVVIVAELLGHARLETHAPTADPTQQDTSVIDRYDPFAASRFHATRWDGRSSFDDAARPGPCVLSSG